MVASTPDYIEERKRAELAAIADGGTRGRQEFLDAEAAANERHQGALSAELEAARGRNFGSAAEAEIQRIMDVPHQQSMQGLARDRDIGNWYTMQVGQSEGAYYDALKGQVPSLEAELEAARSGGGGSGGGGSGGGGRGGGGGSDDDWYKTLREDAGGLKSFIPEYLNAASRGTGVKGTPRDLRARDFAMSEYGVPEFALDDIAPVSGYLKGGLESLAGAQAHGVTQERFDRRARTVARETPGNQVKGRKYLEDLARKSLPNKKPKKK